jgi:hypothetical protein
MNYATSIQIICKYVEIFKNSFFKEENFVRENKESSSEIFLFSTSSLQILLIIQQMCVEAALIIWY